MQNEIEYEHTLTHKHPKKKRSRKHRERTEKKGITGWNNSEQKWKMQTTKIKNWNARKTQWMKYSQFAWWQRRKKWNVRVAITLQRHSTEMMDEKKTTGRMSMVKERCGNGEWQK